MKNKKRLIKALRALQKLPQFSKSAKCLLVVAILIRHFEDEEIVDLAYSICFSGEEK